MGRLQIFGEMWRFIRMRGKWWLLPIIGMIVIFAFILIFAQASPLAPFIYTIF